MIVTLELEPEAQSFFNEQRRAYFPAHRNYLEAHLTFFYRLPAEEPAILLLLQVQHKDLR